MVTTTLLATKAPVVIAPAMNTGMYDNPVTQENLDTLRKRGFHIIDPAAATSPAAIPAGASCRTRRPLLWGIEKALTAQDLAGKHILVTAGPTQEAMDPGVPVQPLDRQDGLTPSQPVGHARREATLVSGPTALATPHGVNRVDIVSRAICTMRCSPARLSRILSSRPPPWAITARADRG